MKSVQRELLFEGIWIKINKNKKSIYILSSKSRQAFELLENKQQLMERNRL